MKRTATLALALTLAGCASVEPGPPLPCVDELEITATGRSVLDHKYKPDVKPTAQLCVKGRK